MISMQVFEQKFPYYTSTKHPRLQILILELGKPNAENRIFHMFKNIYIEFLI